MAKCVLIVDDKQSLRQLVRNYLEQEGFRVVEAADGREALFAARHEKPDLIVLDLMMSEMDGIEFIRLHRREADTPIIILTAKLEEGDRVLGLEIGADDYVTKPFSMRELAARVRAVLRRTMKSGASPEVLRAADITVDLAQHAVTVDTNYVDLTPSEFDLLVALISSPGRAFSRMELLDQLKQGMAFEGVERTIDVHIRNLRTKIEPDPANPCYVETVYGIGYRFAPGLDDA
jgi:two-component system alkaline phosphatase synthesis response regulator PhoP